MRQIRTRYADVEQDRKSFRFDLLKSILRSAAVRNLECHDKKLLFLGLSNGWDLPDTPADTLRIRALEKVASDARRLKAAINSLESKDASSLERKYRATTPLSKRLLLLEEMERDASALAGIVVNEKRQVTQLQEGLKSARLVSKLSVFGISCATRNDHGRDPGLAKPLGDQKRGMALPDVKDNATTAMRCVMLALLDAKATALGWGMTTRIIKLGLRWRKEQRESKILHFGEGHCMTKEDVDTLNLFLLKEPMWNGFRL